MRSTKEVAALTVASARYWCELLKGRASWSDVDPFAAGQAAGKLIAGLWFLELLSSGEASIDYTREDLLREVAGWEERLENELRQAHDQLDRLDGRSDLSPPAEPS